jgi:DNA-directed RNA polymerase subunit RPC12/RpoP
MDEAFHLNMKHFKKVKEDFVCINCGEKVEGSGYTNHCPKCLYSLHVDETIPGDRESDCGGLMQPMGMDKEGELISIIHKCVRCGKVMKNKISKNDNFDALIKVSSLDQ